MVAMWVLQGQRGGLRAPQGHSRPSPPLPWQPESSHVGMQSLLPHIPKPSVPAMPPPGRVRPAPVWWCQPLSRKVSGGTQGLQWTGQVCAQVPVLPEAQMELRGLSVWQQIGGPGFAAVWRCPLGPLFGLQVLVITPQNNGSQPLPGADRCFAPREGPAPWGKLGQACPHRPPGAGQARLGSGPASFRGAGHRQEHGLGGLCTPGVLLARAPAGSDREPPHLWAR